MSTHKHDLDLEDWEDISSLPRIKNLPSRARSRRDAKPNRKAASSPLSSPEAASILAEQADREESFDFSYDASRHERVWIEDSLGEFYEQHWIDDVLRLVQGGKEASVYLCSSGHSLDQPWLAAKVYRPRRFRNLKNDHLYREGRFQLDGNGHVIKDSGRLHAIQKRTEFGRELLHTSWIEHEVKTLQMLRTAGADVPEVFVSDNNAILMTYVGDEEVGAPTLNSVRLGREEARPLFERVVHNIELMLSLNRVHGDLSAYNILYWEGEITLIDFPQAIDPDVNRSAYAIFHRDVTRICEYFRRQGVSSRPDRLAAGLWKASGRRLTPQADPALLDPEDDGDLAYWHRFQ